ncbi:uncharacterized protein LOC126668966 [Mercurialis annua]|uniref:uncharacterized protein LOC126668966 n=1 Tax=Mercurialis annua TaxID=3986 RepID=UPI00216014F2|nr:uncharacterized protein LOC126668966 [Mercurialis annua]
MKITGKPPHSAPTFPANTVSSPPCSRTAALNPQPHPDLTQPRRHRPNARKNRVKRPVTPVSRRSRSRTRPDTPFLKWKIQDKEARKIVDEEEEEELESSGGRKSGRRRSLKPVSARKLAAGLWRLQLPDSVGSGGGNGDKRMARDRLGLPPGAGHTGISFMPHHGGKAHLSEVRDPLQSPSSVSGGKNRFFCKVEPSFQFTNTKMEGATKWDPVCLETVDDVRQIYSHMKRLDHQVSAVSMVSALETELEQAQARIHELEDERRSSKKKMEHFLKKVSEERVAWRSKEHDKIRAFIDDIKTDLNRERKNRQRMEIVNSKLVNELADAKVSAKRFMQDYEKERKARELIEEVCDELAKEIGEDKAEVEALKRESMKLREEVDEERRMLQMAEVWREERVQMKLVDAKVALESKYSLMNKLVADLETFLRSRSTAPDLKEMREVESLIQAAASVDIQAVKEFKYDPPNPDDIFSVFEEVNCGELNEREIEPCVAYSPTSHSSQIHTVSPEICVGKKNGNHRHSDVYYDQNGAIEEDESGWETVSHLEDQGSSYSPEGSVPSVNNKNYRDSNVSGSGTDWEENACDETSVTEISELCSVPTRQYKKVSSIAKLWRSGGDNYKIISVDGMNGRLSNGRKSNVGILSPDRGSGKGEHSPDLVGHWSSPDSGNPQITRGMKGCIEWPRGAQKNSLKAKLMEARMESQKVQIRHVLKQKI